MATIYDVAARADVSPATVSRVLNGIAVRPDLEERVRRAASELNFTPSRAARSLRTRSSEVIALIVPDIENPFFTALARGVEDAAQEAGYSVVLGNSDEDLAKEATYLDIALAQRMAGVILAHASEDSDITRVRERGLPVVAVDRSPSGSAIDTVGVDDAAAGAAATMRLRDRGFRRIACITGPRTVETAVRRAAGWRAAAGAAAADDELLVYSDYRVEGGDAAMRTLLGLTEVPDAVVVTNNLMAVGATRALREKGLTPTTFGLAVFGDLPYAPLGASGADVIDLPAREMGEAAAALLLDRIRGADGPPVEVTLPVGDAAPRS